MIPLSFAQRRLWFLNELEGVKAVYNTPLALRLVGALNKEALQGALSDLVDRHESLRTVFLERDGEPYQHILTPWEASPTLLVEDLDGLELSDSLLRAYQVPFDLAHEIPLRAQLFEQGPDDQILLLTIHHIAGDGWSLAPLWRDLSSAYAARLNGGTAAWEELPVQYADYALWQREVLGDESDHGSLGHRQLEYWRGKLDGIPDELKLPRRGNRPAEPGRTGTPTEIKLTRATHARLIDLASENSCTVFMVLQAGASTLLSRLGAGDDIPIGTAIAGRTDQALNDLIGFFVNTLVLRTNTSGNPSFTELLKRVRAVDLEAYANQDLPFERVVKALNPPRVPGRHPLIQAMLTLQNNAEADYELHGLEVRIEDIQERAAQFDIAFQLKEEFDELGAPAGIQGTLLYSDDLFTSDMAAVITGYFGALIDQVVDNPHLRLADIAVPEIPLPLAGERPATVTEELARGTSPDSQDTRLEVLRDIFSQVLGVENVGVNDSFFELGGHSLLAIRLISRVRRRLGVELDVAKIFETPSVAGLYELLDAAPQARPSLGSSTRSR
ncbi:condensation domain-containing protein [Streptomyces sp. NPDC102467]|uniref:condensation domain-containing protein n=1 Tax=Streptomyces sp. NPDC102467 TaxID=3366179 RepID=UPI0038270B6C